MKDLTLGYSPCPNDTFIFHAMVHGLIDTGGLLFKEILEDVETLNWMARQSLLDVSKVSFHALGYLREDYCLLRSGGAFGRGCGPLVVSKEAMDMRELRGRKIAVPGALTTAWLLLQLYDPGLRGGNIMIMPFNRIIEAVNKGEADAGLVIHESRFTYEAAGLTKMLDLGDWWEEQTGLILPLGGIIAKRSLGTDLVGRINRCVRESLESAFSDRQTPMAYIKSHSQELDDDTINRHIDLYVNQFSLDMGAEGIGAAEELFRQAARKGLLPESSVGLVEHP